MTIQYEAKKAALIEQIERAFDGVEREDGVTLHEAEAIDNYADPEWRAEERLKDTETRWQDVPNEDIRLNSSVLHFLDAKGFHYYFPAYLVWNLRFMDCKDEDFWSNTFDTISFILLVSQGREVDELFFESFSLFNRQQRTTIAHYLLFELERLNFMTEDEDLGAGFFDQPREDIQWALDVYWGQFLSPETV